MKFWWLMVFLCLPACASREGEVFTPPPPGSMDMVRFCRKNEGKKVGDGECWALANESFKAAGKKRPSRDLRVWGRLVDHQREQVRAGDVIEFQNAYFSERILTGPNHTAVVIQSGPGKRFTVAEQKFNRQKKVSFREMSLDTLVSGNVRVYRPE